MLCYAMLLFYSSLFYLSATRLNCTYRAYTDLTENASTVASTVHYKGNIFVNDQAELCQHWTDDYHYNDTKYFPWDGSVQEAMNYCRIVEDKDPWCFHQYGFIGISYCRERICTGRHLIIMDLDYTC